MLWDHFPYAISALLAVILPVLADPDPGYNNILVANRMARIIPPSVTADLCRISNFSPFSDHRATIG